MVNTGDKRPTNEPSDGLDSDEADQDVQPQRQPFEFTAALLYLSSSQASPGIISLSLLNSNLGYSNPMYDHQYVAQFLDTRNHITLDQVISAALHGEPDKQKLRETDIWINAFHRLIDVHGIGPATSLKPPLKIAILDGGVHDLFRENHTHTSQIKGFLSFNGETTHDPVGHGTQIVDIILENTKNTELYIAKVLPTSAGPKNAREGQSEERMTRDAIAKGISHAREIWKVDIIVMPFGYHQLSSPDIIQREIEKCNVLDIAIFASAGNNGGNRDRSYPAKYPGVICIHSAEPNGDPSSFNPTSTKNKYNFSVVGEGIEACCSLDEEGHRLTKHATGTSFATAMAVCIAAFFVGYFYRKCPNVLWSHTPGRAKWITKVFEVASNERHSYHWISPMLSINDRGSEFKAAVEKRLVRRGLRALWAVQTKQSRTSSDRPTKGYKTSSSVAQSAQESGTLPPPPVKGSRTSSSAARPPAPLVKKTNSSVAQSARESGTLPPPPVKGSRTSSSAARPPAPLVKKTNSSVAQSAQESGTLPPPPVKESRTSSSAARPPAPLTKGTSSSVAQPTQGPIIFSTPPFQRYKVITVPPTLGSRTTSTTSAQKPRTVSTLSTRGPRTSSTPGPTPEANRLRPNIFSRPPFTPLPQFQEDPQEDTQEDPREEPREDSSEDEE